MMEANSELLTLAAKAGKLASQLSQEEKVYRAAGRLARDPLDFDAFSAAIVDEAKAEHSYFGEWIRSPETFLLLQFAMEHVSCALWENLWVEKYPDRLGQAWEGEDFELMSVWRKEVRVLIKECHQGLIFEMSADEYASRLTDLGCNEEVIAGLADWRADIMYEETASAPA